MLQKDKYNSMYPLHMLAGLSIWKTATSLGIQMSFQSRVPTYNDMLRWNSRTMYFRVRRYY